jgi:hypothetical protein
MGQQRGGQGERNRGRRRRGGCKRRKRGVLLEVWRGVLVLENSLCFIPSAIHCKCSLLNEVAHNE